MILILHFGSKKVPLIQEAIEATGMATRVVIWDETQASDFENIQGLVFSGSPTFLTEVDHAVYHERFGFLKAGKVPLLGICFGHQVLGIIHGAHIFRGPEVRTAIPIHTVHRDLLLEGLPDVFEMTEDHTEGITLPASFVHLAYSAQYLNEAMRHPTLPLWGVQFHPETAGDAGWRLLHNFVKYCVAVK